MISWKKVDPFALKNEGERKEEGERERALNHEKSFCRELLSKRLGFWGSLFFPPSLFFFFFKRILCSLFSACVIFFFSRQSFFFLRYFSPFIFKKLKKVFLGAGVRGGEQFLKSSQRKMHGSG